MIQKTQLTFLGINVQSSDERDEAAEERAVRILKCLSVSVRSSPPRVSDVRVLSRSDKNPLYPAYTVNTVSKDIFGSD